MSNKGEIAGWPLDMQIKWALKNGKNLAERENILAQEPVIIEGELVEKNNISSDIYAHKAVVEEQIEKIAESLNDEMSLLRSEVAVIIQNDILEEKIDKLAQDLNKELLILHNDVAMQNTTLEDQVAKLSKLFTTEILSLQNEFKVFVQTRLQEEKAAKVAEVERENSIYEREIKLQVEIHKILQNILEKLAQYFQCVDQKLQQYDQILKEEITLLTEKLLPTQQVQENKDESTVNDCKNKFEERQERLIEDMGYIQYVVEEIATRPQSLEAQQKLREKFLIREMAVLKEKMDYICKKIPAQGGLIFPVQDVGIKEETPSKREKKHRRRW